MLGPFKSFAFCGVTAAYLIFACLAKPLLAATPADVFAAALKKGNVTASDIAPMLASVKDPQQRRVLGDFAVEMQLAALKHLNTFNPKIFGPDIIAASGQFPYMAALFVKRGSGELQQFCGATLIGPRRLLTAGHCKIFMDDRVYYVVGQTDIGDANTIAVPIDHIERHPQYLEYRNGSGDVVAVSHDVAVVVLKADAAGTQFARLYDGAGAAEAAGKQTTVIGWGVTDTSAGATSSRLLGTHLFIGADADCKQAYSPYIDAGMLCAAAPGKDACEGDSGGPLLLTDSSGTIQIGVVSFGDGCAKIGYPTVYSKVNVYRSWITSQ
jgi:secreted trypsin-like serine protease